jgi:SAM-dependent methyltransferase
MDANFRRIAGLSVEEWEYYLKEQAKSSASTRNYIYRRINITRLSPILEVGAGSGVISRELVSRSSGPLVAIDQEQELLNSAKANSPGIPDLWFCGGRGEALPFNDGLFSATLCHMTLFWCQKPGEVVKEMARVTKSGGWVVALAEPDYGGMLSYPLAKLAELSVKSLDRDGLEPFLGRKLRQLFVSGGLETEVGVPGQVLHSGDRGDFELSWWLRRKVWRGTVSEPELERMMKEEAQAVSNGEWMVYLPWFYALGRKK